MLDLLKSQRIFVRKKTKNKRKGYFRKSKMMFSKIFKRIPFNIYLLSGIIILSLLSIIFSFMVLPSRDASALNNNANEQLNSNLQKDLAERALELAYNELGAGSTNLYTRENDVEYIIEEGDSLYGIGKLYAIDPQDLIIYNKITNPYLLKIGQKIIIPSIKTLKTFKEEQKRLSAEKNKHQPKSMPMPKSLLPGLVNLDFQKDNLKGLFTATFFVKNTLPEEGIFYYWDLGDGSFSQNKTVTYTYLKAGTYTINLTLKDKYGYEQKAEPLTFEVSAEEGSRIVRVNYLSLNAPGEIFALAGKIVMTEDFLGNANLPVEFIEERDNHYFYKAVRPGYFYLIARNHEALDKIYLFVSPVPSIHSDRFDLDWYRTQFGTGLSNCGPATVSMAVAWAKGEFIPVSAVRKYLGWQGNGGTSFYQLLSALQWRGVKAELVEIATPDDIFEIIDQNKIAIILFHTSRVSRTTGRPELNLFGRYYIDSVRHYVVVKGYSVDKKYFIIYDPIPSDWVSNSKRYGDGVSMLGRNRYYPVAEIFSALSLSKILVISR